MEPTIDERTTAPAAVDRSGNPQKRLWAAYLSGGFGLSISAMLGLLVPLRADELGIAVGAIGVLVAARSAAETVLAVPLSSLIARLGAKWAFVLSTTASAVVAAGFALAEGFWTLLLLNVAMGAARALGWVSSQTYIAGQYDPAHRARDTGRFSFVSNLSQMVTPLMVGSAAAVWGYQAAFLVVAAYCALYAVNGLALAPPRRSGSGDRVKLRAAAALFRLPRMQIAMLLTFVRLWVPNIWTPLFPLLLVSAGGASPQTAGAVVSFAAAVATLVNLLTGRLSRWASPEVLCTIVLACGIFGLVIAPFVLTVPAAFVSAAFVGVANGLSLPLLIVLVSEAAPKGQRGLALATRNAVNSFSGTLGPLGTGWLVTSLGAATAFPVAGGMAALLLGGVVAIRRTIRTTAEPSAPGGA